MDINRNQNITPPAEGERRAIRGYVTQYDIAANLILKALRQRNLEWIRLADPKAGQVDDFQLASPGRLDAYQVKSAKYGDTITYWDLLKEETTEGGERKPCLIRQLADGWRRLKAQHPTRRIVVHLVTNQHPSNHDKKSISNKAGFDSPGHFAAFLAEAWQPYQKALRSAQPFTFPDDWEPARRCWRDAAGLSDEAEFEAFVRDMELEFNVTPDIDEDVKHIASRLLRTVADPADIVELDCRQLLRRLGWEHRFEFRNRHEFPVDERLYEPIAVSEEELERKIAALRGGYLGVFGSPGSGKSTLLTQALTRPGRKERIVRYYAYVPESMEPQTLRGESEHFLHDIVWAFKGAGPLPEERAKLLELFYEELGKAGETFRQNGLRTLVLVDGLDHIEREQHPSRSLLNDLPTPDQIPEGVLFILSSQTDICLPPRVQASVRRSERRIEMQALSREGVRNILEKGGILKQFSPKQVDKVFELTDGHPLALRYLMERLVAAEDIGAVLDTTQRFSGRIEEDYQAYWQDFVENGPPELNRLLGFIARLRGAINLEWIERWPESSALDILRQRFAHYFRRETATRWYFFHNSFRLFLLEKTAEDVPGEFNERKHRMLHRDLAERCAQLPNDQPCAWERVYHLHEAEEYQQLLELVTSEYFTEQLNHFRPIEAILSDIRLILQAAAALQDPIALFRGVLLFAEYQQRDNDFEYTHKLASLLLQVGRAEAAVQWLREGNRLRVSAETALGMAVELFEAGYKKEAHRLFSLAEPLHLFSSGQPIDVDRPMSYEPFEAWAQAAIYFRDVEEVIRTIRALVWEPRESPPDNNHSNVTRIRQNHLLYEVGLALINAGNWEGFSQIPAEFESANSEDKHWWFRLHWRGAYHFGEKSEELIQKVLRTLPQETLNDECRVALAEAIYLILKNEAKARELLTGIDWPPVLTDLLGKSFEALEHRFRLYRLKTALNGRRPSLLEAVPDSPDRNYEGLVLVERAFCRLAGMSGELWTEKQLDDFTFSQDILSLLWLFHRSWEQTRDWLKWHEAKGKRFELYSLLVDIVAQHGQERLHYLAQQLDSLWKNQDTSVYWPADTRRTIALKMAKYSMRDWAVKVLEDIEATQAPDLDVHGKVTEAVEQAEAWLELEYPDRCVAALQRSLKATFGVGYHKDYQLDKWIDWMQRLNQLEPENIPQRLSRYAYWIVSEEGAAGHSAKWLLRATYDWSPRRAVHLFRWFLDEHVIGHQSGLEIFLEGFLEAAELQPDLLIDVALTVLAELYLPIVHGGNSEEITKKLLELAARRGSEEFHRSAKEIWDAVTIAVRPDDRAGYARLLKTVLEANGINPSDIGIDSTQLDFTSEESSSPETSTSTLESGEKLDFKMVCERLRTNPEDVFTLAKKDSYKNKYSGFPWHKAVVQVAEQLTDIQAVNCLAEFIENQWQDAFALIALSKQAFTLGNCKLAEELAEKALASSYKHGWYEHYDGGSRLHAFEWLSKLKPADTIRRIYEFLARDIDNISAYSIALNFDQIASFLNVEEYMLGLCREAEAYTETLFAHVPVPDEPLPFFVEPLEGSDGQTEALVELLLWHLTHPVDMLATSSLRGITHLTLTHPALMTSWLRFALKQKEDIQARALMVLEAVARKSSEIVRSFLSELRSLADAQHFALRETARRILRVLGEYSESVPTRPTRLVLPSIFIPRKVEDNDSVPHIIPSSKQRLQPFDKMLELISDLSGISETLLFQRAVNIMNEMGMTPAESEKSNKKLRAYLDSAGLQFPYVYPRAKVALMAVNKLIVQLVDEGRFNYDALAVLSKLALFHDPDMILWKPTQRPTGILPLDADASEEYWLSSLAQANPPLTIHDEDGWFILGETMELSASPPLRSEYRRAALVVTKYPILPDAIPNDVALFLRAHSGWITDYRAQSYRDDKDNLKRLIIQHQDLWFETPGVGWLAPHPEIGHTVGWQPAPNNNWDWLDKDGRTVIRVIGWQDGPPHIPYGFKIQTGKGWRVIVRPDGFVQLEQILKGCLVRIVKVERAWQDDDKKTRKRQWIEQVR